jgi:hypothetical protein
MNPGQQLAGEPPACAVKQGMAFRINKQLMCSQKSTPKMGKATSAKRNFQKNLILEL